MSLRRALEVLPDDAESRASLRQVLGFFQEHQREAATVDRVAHATGIGHQRVRSLIDVLASAFVLDCAGNERDSWIFDPTPLDELEIQRFMRITSHGDARLQRGADRFRTRFGHGR